MHVLSKYKFPFDPPFALEHFHPTGPPFLYLLYPPQNRHKVLLRLQLFSITPATPTTSFGTKFTAVQRDIPTPHLSRSIPAPRLHHGKNLVDPASIPHHEYPRSWLDSAGA